MLLIGSRAMNYYFPNRTPKDWDVICSFEEMELVCKKLNIIPVSNTEGKYILRNGDLQIEFEIAENNNTAAFFWGDSVCETRTWAQPNTLPGWKYTLDLATKAQLFSIKKSHIYYPRLWDKHIRDYHELKCHVGFDRYPDITKLRQKETETRLGKLKTPSLDKTKDDFFDDNVSNRTFIHDDIHKVMAHYDSPMYERIKVDPTKVTCSKDKFFNELSNVERVMCVLEEAYVIALERKIIPMLYEGKPYVSSEAAFEWAVMRICTTLCSGWFREFAIENWPALMSDYNKTYTLTFLKAVENKQINFIH